MRTSMNISLPAPLKSWVEQQVEEKGYSTVNVDATVIAEEPKLARHIATMCMNIAADLDIAVDRVNVKATTSERLGFTGRGEGIAAEAVCLVERRE